MKNIILLILLSVISISCVGSRLLAYAPQSSVDNPKEIIERVILSQPGPNAPGNILVENNRILITGISRARSRHIGFVTSGGFAIGNSHGSAQKNVAIYYRNINNINLYKRNDYFVVLIHGIGKNLIYRVTTYDQKEAELFVDALTFFRNQLEWAD